MLRMIQAGTYASIQALPTPLIKGGKPLRSRHGWYRLGLRRALYFLLCISVLPLSVPVSAQVQINDR